MQILQFWLKHLISSQTENKIALTCCCIISGTAAPHLSEFFSSLLSFSLSSLSLGCSGILCSYIIGWAGGPGSAHQTCDLELSLSLCQAFFFILLSQNWKCTSSVLHAELFFVFSFYQSITSYACICSVGVRVCVCVRACMCACLWWNACIHRPLSALRALIVLIDGAP